MPEPQWLERQTETTLARLIPRLEARFAAYANAAPADWATFKLRLDANFPRLFRLLLHLYGSQYDFFYHLEELLVVMAQSWLERAPELKSLDTAREANPDWFLSNEMLGGVCYVDLFAGDLNGIRAKIPYLNWTTVH
jgi:amylosucrase